VTGKIDTVPRVQRRGEYRKSLTRPFARVEKDNKSRKKEKGARAQLGHPASQKKKNRRGQKGQKRGWGGNANRTRRNHFFRRQNVLQHSDVKD